MTTTFEDAQVGDRVWCMYYRKWTTITDIIRGDVFPIKTDINSYTMEGQLAKGYARTLFWDEVTITPPPKPSAKLEVDTKVIVWDEDSGEKYKSYFSHFDEKGDIYVFYNGRTSWNSDTTIYYSNWELAKD